MTKLQPCAHGAEPQEGCRQCDGPSAERSYMPPGLEGFEETHFPGEQALHSQRIAALGPRVRGRVWPRFLRKTYSGPKYHSTAHVWDGDRWIGSLWPVLGQYPGGGTRHEGYRIDDGQLFAHYGGPSGAETCILDRWRCGKEPSPPGFFRALWLGLPGRDAS